MNVTLPPLPSIKSLRDTARRARDWSPLHPRLQSIVQEHMKRQPKTQSRTSTGELDRSIHGVEIWQPGRQSITWGTPVDYAWAHINWRRKNKLPPVLNVSEALSSDILRAVNLYIVSGRRS